MGGAAPLFPAFRDALVRALFIAGAALIFLALGFALVF